MLTGRTYLGSRVSSRRLARSRHSELTPKLASFELLAVEHYTSEIIRFRLHSTMTSAQTFRFFDLPKEVRLMVYERIPVETTLRCAAYGNAVFAQRMSLHQCHPPSCKSGFTRVKDSVELTILRVSRQVYQEAITIMNKKLNLILSKPIRLAMDYELAKDALGPGLGTFGFGLFFGKGPEKMELVQHGADYFHCYEVKQKAIHVGHGKYVYPSPRSQKVRYQKAEGPNARLRREFTIYGYPSADDMPGWRFPGDHMRDWRLTQNWRHLFEGMLTAYENSSICIRLRGVPTGMLEEVRESIQTGIESVHWDTVSYFWRQNTSSTSIIFQGPEVSEAEWVEEWEGTHQLRPPVRGE